MHSLKIAEKEKNKEWYKTIMNNIVPQHNTQLDRYQIMRLVYAILNNDITFIERSIKELCTPESNVFQLPFEESQEIVVYNPLFKYYMFLVGELLKRSWNVEVIMLGDRENKQKDEELSQILEEKVDKFLEEALLGIPEMKRTNPEDVDVQNFKSELQIFYSEVIEYFKNKFDLHRIRSLSFKHGLASDMSFIGVIEKNGIPEPFVANSLNVGFHKSPDEYRTEKGDWWWLRTPITLADAYDALKDKVSQEELDRLGTYTSATQISPNKAWDVTDKARPQFNFLSVQEGYERNSFDERHIGQSTGSNNSNRLRTNQTIWLTYFEFKAYREVIFLTTTTEFNGTVCTIVDSNFTIPPNAVEVLFTNKWGIDSKRMEWEENGKQYYAEKIWIPRRYECKRYGDILVDCREVPNQPLNLDNPFDFELSLKGRIYTGLNAEPISLVQRGLNTLMQYIFVKQLQLRELAKYEGYIKSIDASKIPDYLAEDENGQPLYEGADKLAIWRHFRRKLGDSYYDSTENSAGLPDYQKTSPVRTEVAGSMVEIINMQNLLDLLDRQLGLEMLVPIQATGIVSPNSNVADNQYSVSASYTMTEEYYNVHNDLMLSVLKEYLTQFTNYYKTYFETYPEKTETYLTYNFSEGIQKVIKIKPEYLDNEGVGAYLSNNTANEMYRRNMLQLGVQALSQNRGEGVEVISQLIKSITSGESPEKIHKMLVIAAKKQQDLATKQQEIAMQIQEQMAAKEQQQIAEQREHEINKIVVEKKGDALIAKERSKNPDVDNSGVSDYLEEIDALRNINEPKV